MAEGVMYSSCQTKAYYQVIINYQRDNSKRMHVLGEV